MVIDAVIEQRLRELVDLAPLHQPKSLRGLEAARRLLPEVPHVACFDTAFHATLPPEAYTYALPREWRERRGVRRYGFHGLSHAWAAGRAAEMAPGSHRVVTCHLGAGASLAAVLDGRSVDTTMGFTPLDGLVMATRSGSVDPGLITWLEEYEGLAPHEVADALEHRSGLLGLAGTADMRELLNRTPTSALVVQAPTVVFVCWSSPPGRIYRSPVSSAPWPRVAGRDDFTTIGITTRAVVPCRSRIPDAQAQRMPAETAPASIDAHRDVLWNAAAGLDPVGARLEIEAAIGAALRRNTRLRGHHITVTAGAEGLVTLTGTVPTQALRQEVELSCWTVPGVWTLHDDLAVGRSAIRA